MNKPELEANNPKAETGVGSTRLLACGETLTSVAHGGSAEIVAITRKGVMLKHPSGTLRMNKWSSMMTWKRKSFRPLGYGQIKRVVEATREQANDAGERPRT